MLFKVVANGFARLTRFRGRDAPGDFWPFAGLIVALSVVGMMAAFVPLISSTFAKMQQFAAEHSDQADVYSTRTSYEIHIHGNHPELMPDMSSLVVATAIIASAVVVLLAAAVTRRLHDRNYRGAWGLVPVLFLATGLVGMSKLFSTATAATGPDMSLFGLMLLNNVVYLLSLVLLVIQLAQSGTTGANRFGEDPRAHARG